MRSRELHYSDPVSTGGRMLSRPPKPLRGTAFGLVVIASAVAALLAPARLQAVVITELMYHPAGDNPDAGIYGEEFIELFNESNISVDLSGYRFTHGINGPNNEPDYTIASGTVLASGAYLVLCATPMPRGPAASPT